MDFKLGQEMDGGVQDLKTELKNIGWGPGQPDLVGGNPTHGRGLEFDGLQGSFQSKPFYDCTILCDLKLQIYCWVQYYPPFSSAISKQT